MKWRRWTPVAVGGASAILLFAISSTEQDAQRHREGLLLACVGVAVLGSTLLAHLALRLPARGWMVASVLLPSAALTITGSVEHSVLQQIVLTLLLYGTVAGVATSHGSARWAPRAAALFGAAVAWQVLTRPITLLTPDVRTWIVVLAIPLLAALAATRLGVLDGSVLGRRRAICLAAAALACGTINLTLMGLLILWALIVEMECRHHTSRRIALALALVTVGAAGFLYDPAVGGVVLLGFAAQTPWLPRHALVLVVGGTLMLFLDARPWSAIGVELATLLALCALVMTWLGWRGWITVGLISILALRFAPPEAAAALALIYLCFRNTHLTSDDASDASSWGFALLGLLGLAVSLSAAFPWLRPPGVFELLGALDGGHGAFRLIVVLALVVGAILATRWAAGGPRAQLAAPLVPVAALAAGVLTILQVAPSARFTASDTTIELSPSAPVWRGSISVDRLLQLETALANAATLPPQAPAAVVEIAGAGPGRAAARHVLANHVETAEWSLANPGTTQASTHWIAGNSGKLGRRYVTRLTLEAAEAGAFCRDISITRDQNLPEAVRLTLFAIRTDRPPLEGCGTSGP